MREKEETAAATIWGNNQGSSAVVRITLGRDERWWSQLTSLAVLASAMSPGTTTVFAPACSHSSWT